MRARNRLQILKRMSSKSDQLLNDILKLMQIYGTEQKQILQIDKSQLLANVKPTNNVK